MIEQFKDFEEDSVMTDEELSQLHSMFKSNMEKRSIIEMEDPII